MMNRQRPHIYMKYILNIKHLSLTGNTLEFVTDNLVRNVFLSWFFSTRSNLKKNDFYCDFFGYFVQLII